MIDTAAVVSALVSHAKQLGVFENVLGHEPKSAPPSAGLTCVFWAQQLRPIQLRSGLASTSALLTFNGRVYLPMTVSPEDGIDPAVIKGVDALMNAYSGDFDLGGQVSNVDLLGAFSNGLQADAGYMNQDSKLFRVMVLTIPLVLNNVWTQVA